MMFSRRAVVGRWVLAGLALAGAVRLAAQGPKSVPPPRVAVAPLIW